MAEQLTKAAVSQFLEAAKNALNYLSQLKMEVGENVRARHAIDERELLQLYSRTRRVREYLRRWMSAYPTPDGIALPPEDLDLLCSCMLYEFGRVEKLLSESAINSQDDTDWIGKRKKLLAFWIFELAERPIEHLPSPFGRNDLSYDTRLLLGNVRRKLSGGDAPPDPSTGIFMPASATAEGSPAGPARIDAPVVRSASTDSVASQIAAAPAPSIAEPAAAVPGDGNVVDVAHVHDYRLRLAMALDVRSYERAVDVDDHRLATMLLDAILQGLLIDHGLSNANTMGLTGTPLSWSAESICSLVMGAAYADQERALFQMLERSRALLRPAQQLADPMVVNKATVQAAEAFVRRVALAIQSAGQMGGSPHQSVRVL